MQSTAKDREDLENNMELTSFIHTYRSQLASYITTSLATKKEKEQEHAFLSDAIDKLLRFVPEGKLMRGLLVLLAYEISGGIENKKAFPAAAAMEIIHSGLLIHDDIMDNDTIRRGNLTPFAQYQQEAASLLVKDPYFYGISQGICAGDTAFFLAFEELIQASDNPLALRAMFKLFSQELQLVGSAQMLDFHLGQTESNPSEKDIYHVYTYKSGRYTFSLPLKLGAILAGATPLFQDQLSTLGEKLGLIFQIKDDEMGLFGTEKAIGKPVGSDIREDKKTLIRNLLFEKATPAERTFLVSVFGNKTLTDTDIEKIRAMVKEKGILEDINQITNRVAEEAQTLIQEMNLSQEHQQVLEELLAYNLKREK